MCSDPSPFAIPITGMQAAAQAETQRRNEASLKRYVIPELSRLISEKEKYIEKLQNQLNVNDSNSTI
jgi:hypothetical protein